MNTNIKTVILDEFSFCVETETQEQRKDFLSCKCFHYLDELPKNLECLIIQKYSDLKYKEYVFKKLPSTLKYIIVGGYVPEEEREQVRNKFVFPPNCSLLFFEMAETAEVDGKIPVFPITKDFKKYFKFNSIYLLRQHNKHTYPFLHGKTKYTYKSVYEIPKLYRPNPYKILHDKYTLNKVCVVNDLNNLIGELRFWH